VRHGALLVIAALVATSLQEAASPLHAKARLCSLRPGKTLAVLRVEQDTLLPSVPAGTPARSLPAPGEADDSLLVADSTPMPAARVRLLQLDSTTRAILATHGITDSQPTAYIRAAPYRYDCRSIRWTDTVPFVERGEVGYVRAFLAAREGWIDGVPMLVIPDAWYYPYPRRRGLAFRAPPDAPLASADAMFSFYTAIELPLYNTRAENEAAERAKRAIVIAWARADPASAELEPIRSEVRRAVLEPDWEKAKVIPSRLRGSYRMDITIGGERATWFFRTHDRPGNSWRPPDSLLTTAALFASPHISGYQLVGYPAGSRESLATTSPNIQRGTPLVWFSATDRPTAPGNEARRSLAAQFSFNLAAAPERQWSDLELLVPPLSAVDSAMMARARFTMTRGDKQIRVPLTVRLDARGGVRADTTLVVGGRALRVMLERVDTLSVKRPF
jgi:hypothetical protein